MSVPSYSTKKGKLMHESKKTFRIHVNLTDNFSKSHLPIDKVGK